MPNLSLSESLLLATARFRLNVGRSWEIERCDFSIDFLVTSRKDNKDHSGNLQISAYNEHVGMDRQCRCCLEKNESRPMLHL
jgi:hypothetical protein